MEPKKSKKQNKFELTPEYAAEILNQAVHLKYNIYLLAEAIVFASFLNSGKNPAESAILATEALGAMNKINHSQK